MTNINEILERFKQAMGLRFSSEVARLFGISQSDFSHRKRRGSLLEFIIGYAIDYDINLNWLLTGNENLPCTMKAAEPQKPLDDNEVTELLELAGKILSSGNQPSFDMLAKNIRYCARVVALEEQLGCQEKRLKNLAECCKEKTPGK